MKRRIVLATLLMLIVTALVIPAQPVFAAPVFAGDAAELGVAITNANNNPGEDTIILTADIVLTNNFIDPDAGTFGDTSLPIITNGGITIEGQGHTIARNATAPKFRIFRIVSGGGLTLNNLTVSGGDVTGAGCSTVLPGCGGGIFNQGVLIILHSTISNNAAERGGGVYNGGGNTVVFDSTFSGNTVSGISPQGGGIFNDALSLNITDSVFSGNTSGSLGGGIYNGVIGVPSITDSTFSGNSAVNGGGVYGAATISGNTFSGNSATNGAGLFLQNQSATVTNSTFSGNTATNLGGGIYFADNTSNSVMINTSTFSGNSAAVGGGIVANTNTVTVRNSILANSSPTSANCATIAGGIISLDAASLANDNTCGGLPSTPNINLAALADNGGSTKTFALNPGSAAIDSGNILCNNGGIDQRRVSRPPPAEGHCDVGAFEYGGVIRTLQFATPTSSITVGTSTTIPVVLTLDSTLTGGASVVGYVWVTGGTAVAGTDYAPFGVQIVFINPGNTAAAAYISLLNTPTTDKTVILSFATQSGPGFSGPVRLGTIKTHTLTLKISPPTSATNRNFFSTHTPTLSWNRISSATGYEIQVDTDMAFLAPYSFANTNIPANQLSIQTTFLANGVYYWRVRAKGGTAAWSAPERFEVFALP